MLVVASDVDRIGRQRVGGLGETQASSAEEKMLAEKLEEQQLGRNHKTWKDHENCWEMLGN